MMIDTYTIKEMVTQDQIDARLAESLREGALPDCFLYTAAGARNWLRLDASPEFPVARGLTTLLRDSINALVPLIPPVPSFLSMGVGAGDKEKILLKALLQKGSPRFYAVDISRPLLETALENFRLDDLPAVGIVAFLEDLALLLRRINRPVLFSILGNTFCNYHPESLLALVRRNLRTRDLLLFDCRLYSAADKPTETSYRSSLNAAFNLGPLLNRGMTPDSFRFSLDLVSVTDPRLGALWKTRKSVRVLRTGAIRVGRHTVPLLEGDELRMGFTWKFTKTQVEILLRSAGFAIVKQVLSPAGDAMILLTRKNRG